MKSEHKKEIELRDAAYSALKNEYEMKIKEIENLKVEYECQLQSLTKRNEEYIQKLTNNYTIAQQVICSLFVLFEIHTIAPTLPLRSYPFFHHYFLSLSVFFYFDLLTQFDFRGISQTNCLLRTLPMNFTKNLCKC
jgi:hypothetical protein